MSKFKIQDKVKVVNNLGDAPSYLIGNVGKVVDVWTVGDLGDCYAVRFYIHSRFNQHVDTWYFIERDLELVREDLPKSESKPIPKSIDDIVKSTEENVKKTSIGLSDLIKSGVNVKLIKNAECITENVNELGGKKFDQGKLDYTLLLKDLPKSVESVVKVLTLGSTKYGRTNYNKVETERYEAALTRHLMQYLSGEKVDSESGESHLSHIVCCCLFLVERGN